MKDILITSSVLILAVLLIRFLFRNTISRRVQYALWALVLLRLLLPVNLPALAHNVLSAAQPVRETVSAAVERPVYRLPYAAYPVTVYTPEELPDRTPGTVLSEGEGSYGVVDETSETVVFYRQRIQPAQVLRGVWLAGMAAMGLWLLISNLRFARRLRRTRVPLEEAESAYPVYLCDDIPSPCLFGFFRPAIYVTSEAARDPARLRCVLAHEETHARHMDPLWALFRGVCLAVWWFDPLVWLAAHCSRIDCELACDESTLARLGEETRTAYGETLLALIPRRAVGHPLLSATTMTAGKRQMKERLTRIAEHRRPLALALLAALALLLAACAATFTGAVKPESAATPEPADTAAPTQSAVSSGAPGDGVEVLTGAELQYFNETFFNASVQDGEEWKRNLHNQFLFWTYDSPADIDLFELFYSGQLTGYEPLSDEEQSHFDNGVTGTHKYPAAEMDAVFYANTGLHLDETKQIGLDRFTYLPEYDAYYHTHGDTNMLPNVFLSAGTREGELVRLWYDLGGWRCVTLREQGDGGWHFVSNTLAEKPAIPTALPAGEPFAVIPLDGLTPYAPETYPLEEPRSDFTERRGGWLARDGVVVRFYTDREHRVYAAVEVSYENNVYTARPFLTVPNGAVSNPGVEGFGDLFGHDRGLIVHYDDVIRSASGSGVGGTRCFYFDFAEDGAPTLVAELSCFGGVGHVIDLDGDGTNELVSTGWDWLYFQRNGTVYRAEVEALLRPYVDGLTDSAASFNEYYRCLCINGWKDGRHHSYYVYFDGDRLLVYPSPELLMTGSVAEGVEAPEEVLTFAKLLTEQRAKQMMELAEGPYSPALWLDGWRINALDCTAVPRGDWTVEVYRLDAAFHTNDPDKVFLAGGTHVTEDDWVVGWYDPAPYLFYVVPKDAPRWVVPCSVGFEFGPGNEVMFPVVLDWVELQAGLRGPETVEGKALWRMFRLLGSAETLNVLGEARPELCADALERMLSGARELDDAGLLSETLATLSADPEGYGLTDAGYEALNLLKELAGEA